MQSPPDIPDIFDGFRQAAENADPANWEWSSTNSRALWTLASENFQEFKNRWYGATDGQFVDGILPLWPDDTIFPSSIIVRRSYIKMFDVVWTGAKLRQAAKGVIIIGQPGIGKSLFQFYLLARLLQRKQVVVFSLDGSVFHLFHHDGVYQSRLTVLGMSKYPWLPQSKGFIWSLLDIFDKTVPPRDLVYPPCLPVQTASPDPARYAVWKMQRLPLLTGLPLWTREELALALPYQRDYSLLLDALSSPDLLAGFPGARALLDERGEDATSLSPLDAVNYLLDAAIERFGYSARDVFHGVFDYTGNTREHQQTFRINYQQLQASISTVLSNGESVISNRILALSPHYEDLLSPPTWTVNFKSGWVAKSVLQELSREEETVICQKINFLQRSPQTKAMAGWYFEPFVHRCLTQTSSEGGHWPLVKLDSDDTDSPRFFVASSSSSGVPDDAARFAKVKRKIVYFQSIADLPEHLENKTYYIPTAQNFLLVDAFTIDLDPLEKSAILWAIQITTSPSHRRSPAGYQHIRNVIACLKKPPRADAPPKKKMKVDTNSLQVRYILVDESRVGDLSWQFPAGWNQNCSINDHRGKVYRLEIPLVGM